MVLSTTQTKGIRKYKSQYVIWICESNIVKHIQNRIKTESKSEICLWLGDISPLYKITHKAYRMSQEITFMNLLYVKILLTLIEQFLFFHALQYSNAL